MKFLTFLILFITFRPNIDFLIVFVVVLYHFMSILNWLTFKRSAYVIKANFRLFHQWRNQDGLILK
jgi:hypothetical protein